MALQRSCGSFISLLSNKGGAGPVSLAPPQEEQDADKHHNRRCVSRTPAMTAVGPFAPPLLSDETRRHFIPPLQCPGKSAGLEMLFRLKPRQGMARRAVPVSRYPVARPSRAQLSLRRDFSGGVHWFCGASILNLLSAKLSKNTKCSPLSHVLHGLCVTVVFKIRRATTNSSIPRRSARQWEQLARCLSTVVAW